MKEEKKREKSQLEKEVEKSYEECKERTRTFWPKVKEENTRTREEINKRIERG